MTSETHLTQLAASGVAFADPMNRMGHKKAKPALEVYARADPGGSSRSRHH